ncbi:hypothetical protein [uncultured Brachyspira sp.]|uniref:hypothetical protein n=1 Tax=uncultured Brachyspira sp. TaxID=221953 RepID=UPI0025DB8F51|nr:hypothetical protein [uncultured Brachyspira sp.]
MDTLNFSNIEQIMTFYLIFNFIIFMCLIYIVVSLLFRLIPKKKEENKKDLKQENKKLKRRKRKDIIELFWTEDKDSKSKTIIKRAVFIFFIIFTSYYIFNSVSFIIENIDIVKRVLKIE